MTDAVAARAILDQSYNNTKVGGRLLRWSLAVSEFDYDVTVRKGTQHGDADGLSRNPLPSCDPYDDGPTTVDPHHVLTCICGDPGCDMPGRDQSRSTELTTLRADVHKSQSDEGLCSWKTRWLGDASIGDVYTDTDGSLRLNVDGSGTRDPLWVPPALRSSVTSSFESSLSALDCREFFYWPQMPGFDTHPRRETCCTVYFPNHECDAEAGATGDHGFADLAEFQKHQAADEKVATHFSTAGEAPDATKVGSFWRGADGVLRRMHEDGQSRLVVPECLKAAVLQRYHGLPISGHQGRKRTYAAVSRKFWWPSMRADVGRWVKACRACKARKTPRPLRSGIPATIMAHSPWEELSLDILGASCETSSGFKYILTCQCLFSRWAVAIPLRTRKAKEVGEAIMNHVLCRFGRPKRMRTDEGKEFVNAGLRYMCKRWCIDHLSTGGYQSQANPVERWHRYVNSSMTALSDAFGKDWDTYLQVVVFNYNVSVCESTGYSPYELMFGRPQGLLQDVQSDMSRAKAPDACDNMAQDLSVTMEKAYEFVRETQLKAAERNRQRRLATQYQKDLEFDVGDLAMFWEPKQKKLLEGDDMGVDVEAVIAPGRWTANWTGPHKVVGKSPDESGHRYSFWHENRKVKIPTHINKLSKFVPWSEDQPSTSAWLDGKMGFEVGGRVSVGSLIAIPLQGDHQYGIAKVLATKPDGLVEYQWYGNAKNDLTKPIHPGWTRSRHPKIYYAAKKQHPMNKEYIGHDLVKVRHGDVIVHGFSLSKASKLSETVKTAIETDIRVGGT